MACATHSPTPKPPDGEVIAADSTVETYYLAIWDEKPDAKTRLFTFHREKDGYTLIDNATGGTIRRNIHYRKTFGGAFPYVQLQVISSQFVAFPETIKGSEVPDEQFCDMKAVTRIYDLKRRRMLPSNTTYQYNHNVPLKYDLDDLVRKIELEKVPG